MGRLIPAGTGLAKYKNIGIQIDAPEELLAMQEEEEATAGAEVEEEQPTAAAESALHTL